MTAGVFVRDLSWQQFKASQGFVPITGRVYYSRSWSNRLGLSHPAPLKSKPLAASVALTVAKTWMQRSWISSALSGSNSFSLKLFILSPLHISFQRSSCADLYEVSFFRMAANLALGPFFISNLNCIISQRSGQVERQTVLLLI